jgi:septal ring factor EnvC (AmiA/AmiB activator)
MPKGPRGQKRPAAIIGNPVMLMGLDLDQFSDPQKTSDGCRAGNRRLARRNMQLIPRQGELDKLVLGALADQLMTPERLTALLGQAVKHRREMASHSAAKRTALKTDQKNIVTQIERLLTAVADGSVPDMALRCPVLYGDGAP